MSLEHIFSDEDVRDIKNIREIREIREKAHAKLNISLDVAERRDDGFHNMVMVMQTVSLADDVLLRLNSTGKITVRTNMRFVPSDERNLAFQAALRYLKAIDKERQGVDIEIFKRIPVGAGMAGGSSDAAAVLRGMNRLFDNALSEKELEEISSDVGSDVPFCVRGGTALAKGRGEILAALPRLPECTFVICKPAFSISTPELFKKLDMIRSHHHPDTAGIVNALESGDLGQICRRMYNVFESVDDRRMKAVSEIKGRLLDSGAIGAVMTGTGSAVFGIYTDADAAERASEELGKDYGFSCVAKPVQYR